MPDMTAGDDATQIYTDSGTINVGTTPSITEIREIARDVAKSVFLDLLPAGKNLVDARIDHITDQVIQKIAAKDEFLYSRFSDPRFLGALASTQRSFAETGDTELGGILSGLLTDLAAEPIRTRREIVLRASIECAPKLTTKHLNALSVIFRINRIRYPYASTPTALISQLDADLSPYFEEVPIHGLDYEYMGATEAGTYLRMTQSPISDRFYYAHKNAMYDSFDVNEFVDNVKQNLASFDEFQSRMDEIVPLLKIMPDDQHHRIKLDSADGERILSYDNDFMQNLSDGEKILRNFLQNRSIAKEEFAALIPQQAPRLSAFLDLLKSTGALNFQLSPVGLMLARHEIVSRVPHTAEQLDALFDDSHPLA